MKRGKLKSMEKEEAREGRETKVEEERLKRRTIQRTDRAWRQRERRLKSAREETR